MEKRDNQRVDQVALVDKVKVKQKDLIQEEEKETGSITLMDYWRFL